MMKWMLAAGAAALAIAAPTAAERGGKGGGQQAQKAERGGGDRQARSQRGGGDRQIQRPQRGSGDRQVQRSARTERRDGNSARGGDRRRVQSFASFQGNRDDRGRGSAERQQRGKVERTEVRGRSQERSVRVNDNRGRSQERNVRVNDNRGRDQARFEARGRDRDRSDVVRVDNNRGRDRDVRTVDLNGDRMFRVRDFDRRDGVRFRDVDRDDLFVRRLGYGVGGCPPGLAKKGNGCLPPGQAAKFIGQPIFAASRLAALDPLPRSLSSLYWDDDDYYYRYGGGYLYRVDRDDDLIDGLIPLFGAALLGQQLSPYSVNSYYRPSYFNSFYPNSPYDCYQYGYGYVYETDCASGLVEDVIPTYDYGYGIGQMLPASYSYYNVPYAYRSYYSDNDDYYYRYAPGAIYQVDRETALISAVVSLLSGGLSVGQPLPAGYSAYNVPLAYRSTYYDQPDVWYRYDDGYIYAVDPGSRMVRSVEYVIV